MSQFEKWFAESGHRDSIKPALMQAYQACAAEAERLCFEQEQECKHDNPCHAADADAIAALREVDR